jgi:hypothetical protein
MPQANNKRKAVRARRRNPAYAHLRPTTGHQEIEAYTSYAQAINNTGHELRTTGTEALKAILCRLGKAIDAIGGTERLSTEMMDKVLQTYTVFHWMIQNIEKDAVATGTAVEDKNWVVAFSYINEAESIQLRWLRTTGRDIPPCRPGDICLYRGETGDGAADMPHWARPPAWEKREEEEDPQAMD